MKTVKILSMAAILFGFGITSADAQVKDNFQNQKERITQGVKSGELTKSETKNIIQDEREIRQDVKLAKVDGDVTKGEKKIILKEQKQLSKEIYRKKHNCRERN
ncbi:MAG TPA: hypothetical protein VGP43_01235 [Chitinophagaceae bacterium]|nr:hypothetical protein [Chitinophagaceae bacterium]